MRSFHFRESTKEDESSGKLHYQGFSQLKYKGFERLKLTPFEVSFNKIVTSFRAKIRRITGGKNKE